MSVNLLPQSPPCLLNEPLNVATGMETIRELKNGPPPPILTCLTTAEWWPANSRDQCWKPNLAPLPGEPSSHLAVRWLPSRPSILEEQRSDFTEIGPSTEYGSALLSAQPSVNLNVYSLSHYPSQHCFWPNNSFSRQKKYSTGSHAWNSNPSYHLPHHLEAPGLLESGNSFLKSQHRASLETIPCKIGVPS